MQNFIIFSIAFVLNSVLLADAILKALEAKSFTSFRKTILFDTFFLAISVVGLFYSIFDMVQK